MSLFCGIPGKTDFIFTPPETRIKPAFFTVWGMWGINSNLYKIMENMGMYIPIYSSIEKTCPKIPRGFLTGGRTPTKRSGTAGGESSIRGSQHGDGYTRNPWRAGRRNRKPETLATCQKENNRQPIRPGRAETLPGRTRPRKSGSATTATPGSQATPGPYTATPRRTRQNAFKTACVKFLDIL